MVVKRISVAAFVLAFALVAAAPAGASFHLLKVNEVLLSSGGNGTAQYVELLEQADEEFPVGLAPYKVVVYDAAGTKLGDSTIPQSVLTHKTQPVLVATTAARQTFSVAADQTLTVGLPSAGKVCFTQGEAENQVSCVSWQCIPDGQALERTSIAGETFVLGTPTPGTANVTTGTAKDTCGSTPPPRDTTKPSLSKIAVSAKSVSAGISEKGAVTVTVERRTKTGFKRVKRLTVKAAKAGTVKAKLPTLSAASYRVTLVAKDAAGNVSKTVTRTLTVKPKR